MKKLNRDWSKKGLPVLKLGLGLGTGVAYYGNIGSDNSKIFTVVGLPAKYSSMLSTLNMQWGADILITQEVHDAMTDQYMMRPITKVDESQVVYELGESKSLDEWVEELNPNEKVDPWKLYREGFESFNAENYKEAHEKLSQYLNDNPYDIPAQKLVQRCAKKLKIK